MMSGEKPKRRIITPKWQADVEVETEVKKKSPSQTPVLETQVSEKSKEQKLVKVQRKPGAKKMGRKEASPLMQYINDPKPNLTPQSNPVYISIHKALSYKSPNDFTNALMDFRLFFRDKDCRAMAMLLDVDVSTVRRYLLGQRHPSWAVCREMLHKMLWYADINPGERVEGLFSADIPENVQYEADWVLVRHKQFFDHNSVNQCGHFVIVNGMEYRQPYAEHPEYNEDWQAWTRGFVRKILGEGKVDFIHWPGCDVWSGCSVRRGD